MRHRAAPLRYISSLLTSSPILLHAPFCIDLDLGPNPSDLSNEAAFRILPIAHKYDMRVPLKYSERAVKATSEAAIRAEEAASKAKEAARRVDPANKAAAKAASQAASEAAKAAHDLCLLALWPSAPIASSQVPGHPGLIQWLALADSLHCESLWRPAWPTCSACRTAPFERC